MTQIGNAKNEPVEPFDFNNTSQQEVEAAELESTRPYNPLNTHTKMCYSRWLRIFCLVIFVPSSQCHDISDIYRLLQDRLANYDKTIRPTANQSQPTVVYFSFTFSFLQELNEVDQKLTVVGIPQLSWTDDMMKWDPTKYGNMTHFLTESGRFWRPNLILVNSAEKVDKIGDDWQSIRYSANGVVYYFPTEMFSVSCHIDVTFYPWDRHFCFLIFTPQSYQPQEVLMQAVQDKVDATYYIPNGAWEYIDSFVQDSTSPYFSSVSVYFLFERKPLFFIVNVILPVIFMAFLSVCVFLIPPDSGERISYTITMLLAIAVFLTLVGDNLPKTSNPMPIFCYYLLSMLTANICITLFTICNLRIFYADESEPVSGFWVKLTSFCKCKKKQAIEQTFDGSSVFHSNTKLPINSSSRNVYIIEEVATPERFRGSHGERAKDATPGTRDQAQPKLSKDSLSQKDNSDKITWKDVSAVLDKLFFLLFFVIFIAATTVYLVVVLDSKRATIEDILADFDF